MVSIFQPMAGIRLHRSLTAAALVTLAACNKAPAEPEAPSKASAEAPAVAPLTWDAPAAWAKLDGPRNGPQKAGYRVEKAGNDKEEAEVSVFFYGTGAQGDPEPNFKEWFGQFDGDVGATAKRDKFQAHGLEVETVEAQGTYKIVLTPPRRGMKKAPVQMVKNGFRLYGAVVKTKDRGNWFFKLVGPDDTVQAARSAMRGMLESAR
jgi:hypothetical protein